MTDSTFTNGTVSLRSANSATTVHPVVSFSNFWIQSVGFTVYTWLRIDNPNFNGETSAKYVNFLGKGNGGNDEYLLRLYSADSPDRPSRLSAYIFPLGGGLGSGAAYLADDPNMDLPPLTPGEWYQVVATYDSGDFLDQDASVKLYINDAEYGLGEYGITSPGAKYANTVHPITPGNGSAPLNLGTFNMSSYFEGALDDVAVFDRKLSYNEIADLYWGGIGIP